MAFVYIVGAGRHMVKVGIAENVRKRLATLQTGSPHRLELIHTIEVPSNLALTLEKRIHRALKSWRAVGEWFAMEHRKAVTKANLVAHTLAREHTLAHCDETGTTTAKVRPPRHRYNHTAHKNTL